ncbi:MAG: phage portal protein, partial [Phaeospirillum sp.]|nr:phage portal protein [Phaeospirillum sp.]
ELERKKIAAMYAMFVISPAPADVIDMVPADDGSGDRIVEVQPGQVVPLEPGEQIQTSAPADVGGSYEPFEYRTLLQISAATGIPYAYLSNDMLKANYSNSRMALLEFRRRVEAWQHSVMVHQMCRVVWQRWMDVAVLSGALDIPGYERNRASFIACSWLPPKWDWVDPLAEAVRSSDRTKVRDVTIDNDVAKFARSHKLAEDDPKVDKYRAARSRQYAEAVKDEARQTTLAYDATLRFKDELAKLNEQRASGTLSEEAYTRRYKELEQDKLAASRDWQDGAIRAVRAYADEAANAAASAERAMSGALRASEDAFVKWAMTGKLAGQDLFNSLAEEALRAAWRMSVVAPLFGGAGGGIFGGMIAGIGSFFSGTASTGSGGGSVPVPSTGNFAIAHTGGLIGLDRLETRSYSPSVFANAPKYHTGGLVAGERPIVARVGEGVFTPKQMDNADRILNAALSQPTAVGVVVTVNNHASGTQARAEQSHGADGRIQLDIIVEEIEGRMNRRIGRGEGMAPVLEHRYGLNPAAGTYR